MMNWRSDSQCGEASLPLATHETGSFQAPIPTVEGWWNIPLTFNAMCSSLSILEGGEQAMKDNTSLRESNIIRDSKLRSWCRYRRLIIGYLAECPHLELMSLCCV